MTFPGILFSVKGSEIKDCYEAKALEKIVHLKETSDKFAKQQQARGNVMDSDMKVMAARHLVAYRDAQQDPFHQFVNRTEHEANRFRILAEHIEPDRIYYLTESQLTEIGLLPELR